MKLTIKTTEIDNIIALRDVMQEVVDKSNPFDLEDYFNPECGTPSCVMGYGCDAGLPGLSQQGGAVFGGDEFCGLTYTNESGDSGEDSARWGKNRDQYYNFESQDGGLYKHICGLEEDAVITAEHVVYTLNKLINDGELVIEL